MTQLVDRPASVSTRRPELRTRSRSDLDLVGQQLLGIEAFNRDRRLAEDAAAQVGRPPEIGLDARRRLDVVRRQHEALVCRLDAQLNAPIDVLRMRSTDGRVIIAHRNGWFVSKIGSALRGDGLTVVAELDNGADAVGASVADQPDLLFVEDRLAMVPGDEVTREVRRYCPDTLVVAQVDYSDRVGALLDAGADAVFTRQVPPADVAARLRDLLPV